MPGAVLVALPTVSLMISLTFFSDEEPEAKREKVISLEVTSPTRIRSPKVSLLQIN